MSDNDTGKPKEINSGQHPEDKTESPCNGEVHFEKKLEECRSQLQRAQAEFSNYRKEEARRFVEFSRHATEDIIRKLLPLKDMLDRAALHIPDTFGENPWVKGVLQITKAFDTLFGSLGVQPILTAGQQYDPKFHEVVEEVTVEGAAPHDIIEEVEAGYMWEDERVIRPAKVKVAK